MKRPLFMVANTDGRPRNQSEDDVFATLKEAEDFILREHPHADDFLSFNPKGDQEKEQIAHALLGTIRELRDALQKPSTPAWKAAALGIRFQNLVMIYRQPQNASYLGRATGGLHPPRPPNDELCMTVLRYLRADCGLTLEKAIERMRIACDDLNAIKKVVIDRTTTGFRFSRPRDDLPDQAEEFSESTIKRHKWKKATRD